MFEDKKQYLNSYLLQESKINRFNRMIEKNPQNRPIYIKEIENAKTTREEIENKIFAIDDEVLSELLFQKYILGLNLEEVGYKINYSKRQTERLHRKALEKFVM
jgi:predicted transcriptional regulator